MGMLRLSLDVPAGERPFQKYWEFVVLLGIGWHAITVPICLALEVDSLGWLLVLNIAWTLFFTVDIYLSLHTAHLVDGEWITDKVAIRRHYMRSWFTVDALATFPFDLLLLAVVGHDPSMLVLVRLVCLTKVVRLLRLTDILVRLGAHGKSSLVTDVVLDANAKIKVALLGVWGAIGMNAIVCGWLMISPKYVTDDPVSTYIMGLYWATTTLTTVGYGDIIPLSDMARLYSTVVMLGGVVMYGLVIGNISTVLMKQRSYEINQRDKVVELAYFLREYRIPKHMQSAIFSYYKHYLFEKGARHAEIVKELPLELQQEINDYVNVFMLRHVPIFARASHACLTDLVHCLRTRTIPPHEKIICSGEVGNEMYFLNYGVVVVQTPDGKSVAKLHAGSFFGEVALLQDVPRTATVLTVTFCDVFILSKRDFIRVMETYPAFKERICRITRKRYGAGAGAGAGAG